MISLPCDLSLAKGSGYDRIRRAQTAASMQSSGSSHASTNASHSSSSSQSGAQSSTTGPTSSASLSHTTSSSFDSNQLLAKYVDKHKKKKVEEEKDTASSSSPQAQYTHASQTHEAQKHLTAGASILSPLATLPASSAAAATLEDAQRVPAVKQDSSHRAAVAPHTSSTDPSRTYDASMFEDLPDFVKLW